MMTLFVNPAEPLIKSWPTLGWRDRAFVILSFGPAICALFAPSLPWFEVMSRKAAPLLDIIELGRGRPWVLFTGMPYPATLRLFGDVSGVMAVLTFIMFLSSLGLNNLWARLKVCKERFKDPNRLYVFKKMYYISVCTFLLAAILFLYVGIVHFILPAPIVITYPLQFAWHVLLASATPWCLFLFAYFLGFFLYFRFFVV
jgi:hypothetical protein